MNEYQYVHHAVSKAKTNLSVCFVHPSAFVLLIELGPVLHRSGRTFHAPSRDQCFDHPELVGLASLLARTYVPLIFSGSSTVLEAMLIFGHLPVSLSPSAAKLRYNRCCDTACQSHCRTTSSRCVSTLVCLLIPVNLTGGAFFFIQLGLQT